MIYVEASRPGKWRQEFMIGDPQFSAEVDDSAEITDFVNVTDGNPIECGPNADGMVMFTVINGGTPLLVAVVPLGNDPDGVEPIRIPANFAYTGLLETHQHEIHVMHAPEA